jgi:hypothetical protein
MENKANYNVSRSFLENVVTPEDTRTYRSIGHKQLIELTTNSIVGAGFKLESEKYTAARDGQIANGRFKIYSVADKEICLEIGWQNSLNKQLSLKFAIGARIFICDNGTVSGEMGAFKKKHQGTVQEFTPTAITEYIKRAADVFGQLQKDREAMKQIEVSDRLKAELIGRMFIEDEFITSTQLNIIARNLKMPEFNYGAPNSMWELYQFTTQSMKEIHPTLWMENHIKAHNFFTTASGLTVPEGIVVPPPGSHPQGDLFSVENKERFDEVLANMTE